ncbi:MAG TPA: YerC/YecD family TrpR-related protein [Patescibacteria group bacterium]
MPRRSTKLSKKEIEKIFFQLCVAISQINKVEEAAEFLRDLISYQEAEMIAKRLKIAEYVIKGKTYDEIHGELGVGFGTIARVQEWLLLSGEGYRKAIDKMGDYGKSRKIIVPNSDMSLSNIKRRYPMYYWPEILLENVVQSMNKKEKEKMRKVVLEMGKMKEKTLLYKQLKKFGF